jgi:hypothetical protein
MNGGTSLRADGRSKCFALSSIVTPRRLVRLVGTAPVLPYSPGFVGFGCLRSRPRRVDRNRLHS